MKKDKSFQQRVIERKKSTALDPKEFAVIFCTLALLVFFIIARFSLAGFTKTRGQTKYEMKKILQKELSFYQYNNRYGTFEEIGFINPFPYNTVEFSLISELEPQSREIKIKAEEVENRDAFGDGVPGNQYFVIDKNGAIAEYKK
jgi:hypothetical protein